MYLSISTICSGNSCPLRVHCYQAITNTSLKSGVDKLFNCNSMEAIPNRGFKLRSLGYYGNGGIQFV